MYYYDVFLLDSVASYDGLFTYKSPHIFQKGDVVNLPFGATNAQREALIYQHAPYRKGVKTISSQTPLQHIPAERVDLLIELSDYYLSPRGDILRLSLPKISRIRKKKIFERSGVPIEEDLKVRIKEALKGNSPIDSEWLQKGYIFSRAKGEDFFLTTHKTKEDLRTLFEATPGRFTSRKRILSDLLDHYPQSISVLGIPASQREYFGNEGSFRFSRHRFLSGEKQPLPLTSTQKKTFESISKSPHPLHLLWGVSASGKSLLLTHLVASTLTQNRRALVLFPDNRVLQAAISSYRLHFGARVGIYQGRMSPSQLAHTLEKWEDGEIDVLLGTRGALLLPLSNLGIILMEECQEDEYLSDYPMIDTRVVAAFQARKLGIKTVFTSATPPVEMLFYEGIQRHLLRESYLPHVSPTPSLAPLPLDKILSDEVVQGIKKTLENGEKSLLLSMRSGYASSVFCRHCGAPKRCERCERPLLYFRARGLLRCPSCSLEVDQHLPCAICGHEEFTYEARGIEKAEEEIRMCFPGARVLRMDHSTSRTARAFEEWEEILNKGAFDILLGDKLITRGFEGDFSFGAALDAEGTLYLPETRAEWKTFSRLYHFFARIGRDRPACSILQTRSSDSHVINSLLRKDLWGFYDEEIRLRREQALPPFSAEILLLFRNEEQKRTQADAEEVLRRIHETFPLLTPTLYEPIRAFSRGMHERRILLRYDPKKCSPRGFLFSLLREYPTLRYRVDPEYLLY